MTALPRLSSATALFLDFDGTLAPIQDDPDTVALPPETASALSRVHGIIGEAVCVISGRDIRDLSARVPRSYWRAGGHGLEICQPGDAPAPQAVSAPRGLSNAIDMIVRGLDGIQVEHKGPVIAVHYRRAPELGETLLARIRDTLRDHDDYKVQAGKMVIEAKPAHANKGRAIDWLMGQAPFVGRTPVMVGDDVTDEDAFLVVNEMGGHSIKVGEGDTAAALRIASPFDVANWFSEQDFE